MNRPGESGDSPETRDGSARTMTRIIQYQKHLPPAQYLHQRLGHRHPRLAPHTQRRRYCRRNLHRILNGRQRHQPHPKVGRQQSPVKPPSPPRRQARVPARDLHGRDGPAPA
jgi:hypothetical protein